MEIRPASLAMVQLGQGGVLIHIEDDVQNVANGLHEIDPHLRLRYSERGGYFVVYWKPDDGDEGDGYLIFTARDLDQRIVQHMRELHHRCLQPGFSFAAELDAVEAKQKAERDHAWDEQAGEIGEALAFAMREDLGYNQSSAFIGKGLPTEGAAA